MRARTKYRVLNFLALSWLLVGLSLSVLAEPPEASANLPGLTSPDFFGIVGRDPWYEWDTNPRYGGSNIEFLENMARELKFMGARYVRIEFRADQRPGVRGGVVDFAKYDAFINDIAPRYGLKVLGLLGYALVNWNGPGDRDLHYDRFNDPPDQPNGSNDLIRFFAFRSRDVIAHYGDRVAAWEVLNEVNYWEGVSLRPETMGALMVYTYGLGKTVNPRSKIIVGAQLAPQPAESMNSYDYLNAFFRSAPVQEYVKRPRPAPYSGNPYPWDGLAWHPYYTDPAESVRSVQRVIQTMRGWGDKINKVWITEVGRRANLSGASDCGLGAEEAEQARYLTEFYTQLVTKNLKDIANIFWFKYEDFYEKDGQVSAMGLVRLARDGAKPYAPNGQVVRYKAAFYAYQKLAGPELPVDPVPAPRVQRSAANPTAPFYFKETGHTLNGPFLDFWLRNGGLPLFGLPLTEPFEELNPTDGKRYLVQYFERERFEYHPEKAGTPFEVLMGLLGNDMLRFNCQSFGPLPPPAGPLPEFRRYFPETGHYLALRFKQYWETRGGLAIFGYPVSEEFVETSPLDGKKYTVQYFERARFELHPEAAPNNQVQLALLGTELLKRRGWLK